MTADDGIRPRFPDLRTADGGYESYYLKACRPDGGLGIWIRYTVHKRPGELAKGSLWFVLFDRSAGGPLASKVTPPPGELGAGEGEYVHIGESRMGSGYASGAAATDQLDASWELKFHSGEDPLFHLPRGWMYRAPIPRTKLLTPHPAARFSGTVRAGERELALEGWPGMVGHNWGAQHAERWIWLHGAGFEGRGEGDWLDAALGRIKVGPLTTPWIANGALSLDGERYALGGPEKARATTVKESPERCEFVLPGKDVRVRGHVGSDRKDFVGWVYADPDGSEHNTVNCSVSDMTLTVERNGREPLELRLSGGAAYELGMRERDHGMPIQPFPDG